MFGFRTFTRTTFISKIGNWSFEFTFGVIEEVTFNMTGVNTANAIEIQENFNFN